MSEIREKKGEKKEKKGKEKRKRKKKKRKGKEKERKGERGKSTSFFLKSLAFRWSGLVKPRSKVRLRNESYTWVSKLRSVTEDPTKEIWEIPSTALQKVGILPTLVYFPP